MNLLFQGCGRPVFGWFAAALAVVDKIAHHVPRSGTPIRPTSLTNIRFLPLFPDTKLTESLQCSISKVYANYWVEMAYIAWRATEMTQDV